MELHKVTTRLPEEIWQQVNREAEARQISKQEVIIAKLREPSGITELSTTEKLDRLMNAVESLHTKVDMLQSQHDASKTSQQPASNIKTMTKDEFTALYPLRFFSSGQFNETSYNKVVKAAHNSVWIAPDARRWVLLAPDVWFEPYKPI